MYVKSHTGYSYTGISGKIYALTALTQSKSFKLKTYQRWRKQLWERLLQHF